MSKRVIAVTYILGIISWAIAIIVYYAYLHTYFFLGELITIIIIMVIASTLNIIAWVGTLINCSRVQAWAWFILTFFFGGVMVLIYLIGGPPPLQEGNYSLTQQGSTMAPYKPGDGLLLPAYQPQQLSALEILQQRYARGEIDTPTFQQMRALLEQS